MLEKFYDDHHKNSGFEIKFICCISVVVFKLLHVYLLHVIWHVLWNPEMYNKKHKSNGHKNTYFTNVEKKCAYEQNEDEMTSSRNTEKNVIKQKVLNASWTRTNDHDTAWFSLFTSTFEDNRVELNFFLFCYTG